MVGQKALASARITPKVVYDHEGVKIEQMIGYDDTPCFAENRITLTNASYTPAFGPSVWIVLDGVGTLQGEDYNRPVKKGDYFFLPYAAQGKFALQGDLVLAECLPGKESL